MTTWQRCLVLYIYLSSCHETVGARIFDTSRGYDASSVSTWRLARKTLLSSNELIRLRQSSPSGSQSSLSRQMLRSSLAWLRFDLHRSACRKCDTSRSIVALPFANPWSQRLDDECHHCRQRLCHISQRRLKLEFIFSNPYLMADHAVSLFPGSYATADYHIRN